MGTKDDDDALVGATGPKGGAGPNAPRGGKLVLALCLAMMTLEAFAYFTVNNVLSLYLTDLFGSSDRTAGAYFGLKGAMSMLYGTLLGPIIDRTGPSAILPAGFAVAVVGRSILATTASLNMALFAMFVPMAIGHGITFSALAICIKQLTLGSVEAASWGFGMYYMAMVLGILICGPVIDIVTYEYAPKLPYRFILGMTAFSSVLGGLISVVVANQWRYIVPKKKAAAVRPPSALHPKVAFLSTICNVRFARFVAFSIVLLPACAVLRNLDGGMFPKFLLRTFGTGVPKGTIYAINPAVDMFGVPLATAKLGNTPHFTMVRVGITIAAFSPLIVAFGGVSLPAVIIFVLVLTTGNFECLGCFVFLPSPASPCSSLHTHTLFIYTLLFTSH
jgi:MFS family permease